VAKVRLDRAGIAELMRSADMAREVRDVAEQIADNARRQGHRVENGDALPVEVESYTTDRAAAAVRLAHPAGIGMQAKYGVLTKATGDAGLEVRGD
jgi:ribosomal protein S10